MRRLCKFLVLPDPCGSAVGPARHPPKAPQWQYDSPSSRCSGRAASQLTSRSGPRDGPFFATSSSAHALGRYQLTMDAAIDLSDASRALDLDNIRFQLMYVLSLSLSFRAPPDASNDND